MKDHRACYVNELYGPTGAGGRPDPTLLRQQVVEFYRGACRDGGDCTNRFSPTKAGDAGTDATPDAATDAVTDSADAGSD